MHIDYVVTKTPLYLPLAGRFRKAGVEYACGHSRSRDQVDLGRLDEREDAVAFPQAKFRGGLPGEHGLQGESTVQIYPHQRAFRGQLRYHGWQTIPRAALRGIAFDYHDVFRADAGKDFAGVRRQVGAEGGQGTIADGDGGEAVSGFDDAAW